MMDMKTRQRMLVILNSATLLIMLLANYAGQTGMLSRANVADISHKYDTLFAPAGYAFTIWGVIFLLLIGMVGYQWVLLRKNDKSEVIRRTGIWLAVSNVANAAWLFCWLNEQLGFSVLCIVALLVSLIVMTVRLRLELDDAPVRHIIFVWFPVTIYLGWIMVATIACMASWLIATGWQRFGLSENTWAILLLIIACVIYLLLIKRRNMREASLVGMWAFIAIAVRQRTVHGELEITALAASLVLLGAIGLHAYKNRKYNLASKLHQREW